MKTSNPPSYDKIFAIKLGSVNTIASGATIPDHRALLIVTTTSVVSQITFTNLDNTTVTISCAIGSIIIPMQIKSYTPGTSTTVYIYGLL